MKHHLHKLKELAKGAERRNILVHRPLQHDVDDQESLNYIGDVEAAIGHLIKILYPDYYKQDMFVDRYGLSK